jgi:hypothetical protein
LNALLVRDGEILAEGESRAIDAAAVFRLPADEA